jgi:hypothetical protein
MSKKKNTLKDLDEFLKQQAASLVSPSRLNEKAEAAEPVLKESPVMQEVSKHNPSVDEIIALVRLLAHQPGFRSQLCDIILGSITSVRPLTAEDKVLINTALYLKHGERWKDAIRDFWKTFKD